MTGTVPQIAASVQRYPAGSGPYSAANYYSAGDVFDQTGSFSVCALVKSTTASTLQVIGAKDNTSQRQWYLAVNSANLLAAHVFKTGAGESTSSPGTVVSLGIHVMCMSYLYVSDGTSVLTATMDNSVAVNVTSGGPPIDVTAYLQIGADQAFDNPWLGYIYRWAMWNRALTADEMTGLAFRARFTALF
jgi:hypothetical protein